MKKVKKMAAVVLLNACALPTSPPPPSTPEWWALGQSDVVCFDKRATTVGWDWIEFRPAARPFTCGDVVGTVGCFRLPNVIEYTVGSEYVLRHEATHAILYKLNNPCWREVGHGTRSECKPCP